MDLPSFIRPHPSESRAGGLALSAALLALPALVAGHARAGAILLAASVVAAAVFVERRTTQASSRARELPARPLSLVPPLSRTPGPTVCLTPRGTHLWAVRGLPRAGRG